MSRAKRGSLSGRRRSNLSNKLQAWSKAILGSTVGLIIIVLAISTLLTYLIPKSNSTFRNFKDFICCCFVLWYCNCFRTRFNGNPYKRQHCIFRNTDNLHSFDNLHLNPLKKPCYSCRLIKSQ